jgi:D-aminoacyl-tRNA deacylase
MRALVQRVTRAEVRVDAETVGAIGAGLLVLVAVSKDDGVDEVEAMAGKLLRLRIFHDENGRMNRSVVDVAGGLLVVSQFTLYGDVRKGNRPGFERAALPETARALYDRLLARLAESGLTVAGGRFAAHMEVELVNDGPVTLQIDVPPESP